MSSEEAIVWIDGQRVPPERALVSVFDRGFLYGDSVFETLRTYRGEAFALQAHVERLAASAARVYIEIPVPRAQVSAEVEEAVRTSGFAECYVRVMITRGVAALGLDPITSKHPLRVMIVAPLTPPPRRDYAHGIAAVSFASSRPADSTEAEGAKIGNYLVAVLAQKKAREQGAKEALIVGPGGRVLEGATSNLFWLEGTVLCTVPISAGILPGITRAKILQVAAQTGLSVEERVPKLETLHHADAVFISSSIREMLSVVRLDDVTIGTGSVHPRVRRLHEDFRAAVGVPKVLVDDAG